MFINCIMFAKLMRLVSIIPTCYIKQTEHISYCRWLTYKPPIGWVFLLVVLIYIWWVRHTSAVYGRYHYIIQYVLRKRWKRARCPSTTNPTRERSEMMAQRIGNTGSGTTPPNTRSGRSHSVRLVAELQLKRRESTSIKNVMKREEEKKKRRETPINADHTLAKNQLHHIHISRN